MRYWYGDNFSAIILIAAMSPKFFDCVRPYRLWRLCRQLRHWWPMPTADPTNDYNYLLKAWFLHQNIFYLFKFFEIQLVTKFYKVTLAQDFWFINLLKRTKAQALSKFGGWCKIQPQGAVLIFGATEGSVNTLLWNLQKRADLALIWRSKKMSQKILRRSWSLRA